MKIKMWSAKYKMETLIRTTKKNSLFFFSDQKVREKRRYPQFKYRPTTLMGTSDEKDVHWKRSI